MANKGSTQWYKDMTAKLRAVSNEMSKERFARMSIKVKEYYSELRKALTQKRADRNKYPLTPTEMFMPEENKVGVDSMRLQSAPYTVGVDPYKEDSEPFYMRNGCHEYKKILTQKDLEDATDQFKWIDEKFGRKELGDSFKELAPLNKLDMSGINAPGGFGWNTGNNLPYIHSKIKPFSDDMKEAEKFAFDSGIEGKILIMDTITGKMIDAIPDFKTLDEKVKQLLKNNFKK